MNFASDLNIKITVTDSNGDTVELSSDNAGNLYINSPGEEPQLVPDALLKVEFSDKSSGFTDNDWLGTASKEWSSECSPDSRSIRVYIDDTANSESETRVIGPKSTVRVSFDCEANGKPKEGTTAWNSFGYHYSIDEVELESTPLMVGVRVPAVPELRKICLDSNGERYTVKDDTDFSFLVYEGKEISGMPIDALDSSGELSEAMKSALSKSERDYRIVKVCVPAGKSSSDLLYISNTDDWTWVPDATYSIVELSEDDFSFRNWDKENGQTVTFVYKPELTQVNTATNTLNRWDIVIAKTDSKNSAVLADAWFGLYSPDKDDEVDIKSLNLDFKPDKTIQKDGQTYYLAGVKCSSDSGSVIWNDLICRDYVVAELKAPVGYYVDPNSYLVKRSKSENLKYYLNITNECGYELPNSGGPGTLPLELGGLLLTAGSLILVKVKRRKLKTKLR